MFDVVSDKLLLVAIRAMRLYGMHPPIKFGLGRMNKYVARAARALHGHYSVGIRARDGRRFLVDPREGQYQMGLLGLGIFEPFVTKTALLCVEEGHTVVDIGANFGWYTTLLSKRVGARGSVHAFEPLPTTFQALKTHCELNACSNVVLNACGLSSAKGHATIHYFPAEPHGNASLFTEAGRKSIPTQVPLTTLDAYKDERGLKRCDFVKCDAEGAEKAIIEGGMRFFNELRPVVLIELSIYTSRLAGHSPQDLLLGLRECVDYRFFDINDEHGYVPIPDPARFEVANYTNVLCVPANSPLIPRFS